MANKFTVQVTNEGIDLMQDSIKNGKVLQFKTVTGSSTAFSDSQLATLSMSNYESIAKNQTGNVSSLENKDGVSNLEIVLDGSTVTNDYTLNSVWVLAQHENEPLKVFAVIKVNTELMVNAYEGDGATNIQINVGIKLDTSQVKMDIKSPGLATVQALELAKEELSAKIASDVNLLNQKDEELAQKIADEKQEKNAAIQEVKDSLSSNISNLDSDIENAKEELNAKIQANSSKNSELEEKINVEKSRALEKEGQLATDLEQETSNRKTSDNDLKKLINDGINTLTNKINPLIDYPRTNGRDLNDFRNNGIWTVLTGFDGKDVSMRHYPQGLTNGALLVFRTNGDAVQGQVLLNTDTKRIYIRQYFGNNGWSEWVETATRQDIQNVETKITNVDNKITNVNNKLTEEQKYRNDGDSRLNDKLTQEVQTRKTETSSLNDKITAMDSTIKSKQDKDDNLYLYIPWRMENNSDLKVTVYFNDDGHIPNSDSDDRSPSYTTSPKIVSFEDPYGHDCLLRMNVDLYVLGKYRKGLPFKVIVFNGSSKKETLYLRLSQYFLASQNPIKQYYAININFG